MACVCLCVLRFVRVLYARVCVCVGRSTGKLEH